MSEEHLTFEKDVIAIVRKINAELYDDADGDSPFGELTYRSNYWVDSVSFGDIPIWCSEDHLGYDDSNDADSVERAIRKRLVEMADFFASARERIRPKETQENG